MSVQLQYLTCEKIKKNQLQLVPHLCDDMSVKANDKTYSQCSAKEFHKDHPKFGYVQFFYQKNPFMSVTTPQMKCLFGIQKNTGNNFQMSLQFTNLTENEEMIQFFKFIQGIEFACMKYLGLAEEDSERFISQIKYDKQNKYDPNLSIKLPFSYNHFETDIYSEHSSVVNLFHIQNFTPMQCDIYIDKIWRMNNKFYVKWKCKTIHL